MSVDQVTIDNVVEFHGHMCAGLAMGIRAAEVALDEIGPHAPDEEVVGIVETDMCAVDAIQFLTGCTFGKGNLVHRDHGKNAYTFIRRTDGKAVWISTRSGAWGRDRAWLTLFARVRSGVATLEERQQFASGQRERSQLVMDASQDELFDVREIDIQAPAPARILATVECSGCHEPTMETRVRRLDEQEWCLPCFDDALNGTVRVPSP